MSKKVNYQLKKSRIFFIGFLASILPLTVFAGFFLYANYQEKLLPQTFIGSTDVSNLNFSQAQKILAPQQISPERIISLSAGEFTLSSSSAQLQLSLNLSSTLEAAFLEQQRLGFMGYLLALGYNQPKKYPLQISYSPQKIDEFINILATAFNEPGIPAELQVKQGKVVINPGKQARSLEVAATKTMLLEKLATESSLAAVISTGPQSLSAEQVAQLQTQANSLLNKHLTLTTPLIDNYRQQLSSSTLIPLLNPLSTSKQELYQTLYQELAATATRSAQEPRLSVEQNQQTGKLQVTEFAPPLPGLSLSAIKLQNLIETGLQTLLNSEEKSLELVLPLTETAPKLTLSATNSLGINEQIGFGESYYAHSIAGRIHNVALTAAKTNNILVAPGEEFSFNQALGPVSSETGFQKGYVIKSGRSELSEGGGVCQVSTTLFRALLDAGLKITLRKPHSYRVAYYELDNQPGFDATVYAGNVDLRFINDTKHYILIHHTTDSKALYMTSRIFGTSDGRHTTISDYKKYNARGAPPAEYIPDPNLPVGVKKQIDWATGGLQTSFVHTIYNADNSIRSQTTYHSNYVPWSSKFLVGTGGN